MTRTFTGISRGREAAKLPLAVEPTKNISNIIFYHLDPSSLRGVKATPVNCQDASGESPLHHAALNGHRDAVELLLKHEASATLLDNKGCSPLHLGAWNGNAEICQLLLSHGPSKARVNEQNNENETSLHAACQYGHTKAASVLIEHRADPTLRNKINESALDLAAQYGRLETVQLLVLKHPELLHAPFSQHSPLHLASRNGHKGVVETLIKAGFDVNTKIDTLGTALHEAALCGKQEVVKILLENGIDSELEDSSGKTAADLLRSHTSKVSQDIVAIIDNYDKESQDDSPSLRKAPLATSESSPERESAVYDALPPVRRVLPADEEPESLYAKVNKSPNIEQTKSAESVQAPPRPAKLSSSPKTFRTGSPDKLPTNRPITQPGYINMEGPLLSRSPGSPCTPPKPPRKGTSSQMAMSPPRPERNTTSPPSHNRVMGVTSTPPTQTKPTNEDVAVENLVKQSSLTRVPTFKPPPPPGGGHRKHRSPVKEVGKSGRSPEKEIGQTSKTVIRNEHVQDSPTDSKAERIVVGQSKKASSDTEKKTVDSSSTTEHVGEAIYAVEKFTGNQSVAPGSIEGETSIYAVEKISNNHQNIHEIKNEIYESVNIASPVTLSTDNNNILKENKDSVKDDKENVKEHKNTVTDDADGVEHSKNANNDAIDLSNLSKKGVFTEKDSINTMQSDTNGAKHDIDAIKSTKIKSNDNKDRNSQTVQYEKVDMQNEQENGVPKSNGTDGKSIKRNSQTVQYEKVDMPNEQKSDVSESIGTDDRLIKRSSQTIQYEKVGNEAEKLDVHQKPSGRRSQTIEYEKVNVEHEKQECVRSSQSIQYEKVGLEHEKTDVKRSSQTIQYEKVDLPTENETDNTTNEKQDVKLMTSEVKVVLRKTSDVEKPSSLDFTQKRASKEGGPLSPTGYVQPPTPDHPPPSPHSAVIDIQFTINPKEKRRSRDMETITDFEFSPQTSSQTETDSEPTPGGSTEPEVSPPEGTTVEKRKKKQTEEGKENIIPIRASELNPFLEDCRRSLIKGSTPSGQRKVRSQIYENVNVVSAVRRQKRKSAPNIDALPEQDEKDAESVSIATKNKGNVETEVQKRKTLIASNQGNQKDPSPMDENEEWAKIENIMASFGGGIARESVFMRELEEDFTKLIAGVKKIQSVGDWLDDISMGQYENLLVANGFDDMDFLNPNVLEYCDLVDIGISNEEHRKQILSAASDLPNLKQIDKDNLPSSVEEWLDSLRLSEYWETFRNIGFDTMEKVRKLWEIQLTTVLDITMKGHQKRILASLGDRPEEPLVDRLESVVDITSVNWKSPDPSSSHADIDLFKYTEIKSSISNDTEVKGQTQGQQCEILKFDNDDQDDDSVFESKGVHDDMLHIRPPHLAHEKSPVKQWRHRPEVLIKGCCNYTSQYLGSTLVKELKGIESTKSSIEKMKKSTDTIGKVPTIILSISYKGVKFIDAKSKKVICEHEIGNIFCACQDGTSLNFFAYITKDLQTHKHYCHVFSVKTTDSATEIILTLGEAFEVAYQVALKERAEESAAELGRKLSESSTGSRKNVASSSFA
ncbi:unnamed protein product [Owenia fusiformis]|uniref:Ankyrin repeat and SAM domain-containing protein 1A-like n=1 Tax=Owenia fusiformis TaxID=6347 RepID=A0A8S4NTT6_OWEFU|nr:unnamed protein product [Owenia fusiformis]